MSKFPFSFPSRLLEGNSVPFSSYATRGTLQKLLNSESAVQQRHSVTSRKKGRRQSHLEAQAVKYCPLFPNVDHQHNIGASACNSGVGLLSTPSVKEEEKKKQNLLAEEKMSLLSGLQHGNRSTTREVVRLPSSSLCSASLPLTVCETRNNVLHCSERNECREMEGHSSQKYSSPSSSLLSSHGIFIHPPSLWSDEEGIFYRFGMGGQVSPSSVPGFSGFFRQHWKDFHVTEMFYKTKDSFNPGGKEMLENVICLPREYDFSIPPLPSSENFSCIIDEEKFVHGRSCSKEGGKTNEERNTLSSSTCAKDGDNSSLLVQPKEEAHASFFSVNVEKHLKEISLSTSMEFNEGRKDKKSSSLKILQCLLHKKHVAHGIALSLLAQTLRIHPRAISVAGMKDYIGDTVQRIRFENVSPLSALKASRIFRQTGVGITLSHFSYEKDVLLPGDLYGNHFKIILRGVQAAKSVIQDSMQGFEQFGFPNYYGCQRFSWFGGMEDASFALLLHNPLVFAFRFLNYTEVSRTLRQLLQRPLKYPHPVQDQYRRNVVRRLRRLTIEPGDLDEEPFLSCPTLVNMYGKSNLQYTVRQNLIIQELWQSFFDLEEQARRPIAQSLSSYLWNQALTLRLHHFGGQKVLEGDLCISKSIRREAKNASDRSIVNREHLFVATPERVPHLSIEDVVHPGFSFQGIELPHNPVGDFYVSICEKYHLSWYARYGQGGLKDFFEPPRPIVRRPLKLTYEYEQEEEKLTVCFALERGCYANVAISELMKLSRCAGSEKIQTVPTPESFWESIGQQDPGYITSLQDIYVGFEDGQGFVGDTEEVERNLDTERKIWDVPGPLFLPPEKSPYAKAVKWGKKHLLRSTQRRDLIAAMEKKRLFEKPLADTVSDDELQMYAGHTVPLPPNAKRKKIRRTIAKRQRQYPGAPSTAPRFHRSVLTHRKMARKVSESTPSNGALPEFQKLNQNSWNVSW